MTCRSVVKLLIAIMLTVASQSVFPAAAADGSVADAWNGLADKALLDAIGASCRPHGYAHAWSGDGGLWQVFARADCATDGSYVDPFSGREFPLSGEMTDAPQGCTPQSLLPVRWWGDCPNRQFITKDIYNIFIFSDELLNLRLGYPPGVVDSPDVFDNGFLKVGNGNYGGETLLLWEPPRDLKGDVARTVFYMFAIYGDGLLSQWQMWLPFVGSERFPFLSESAARQLMVWHRNDPVDDREVRRNRYFSEVQGNVNPFVEFPELAEYLWGTLRGVGYGDEGKAPGGDSDMTPLRHRYTLADERINLSSPYVPSDAAWSVDGVPVTGKYVVPRDLGAGLHEFRFVSSARKGKTLVEIVP